MKGLAFLTVLSACCSTDEPLRATLLLTVTNLSATLYTGVGESVNVVIYLVRPDSSGSSWSLPTRYI
jgi:hypothetical protein